ncbi:MAG: sulfoxide reductase heme-binding subunit YedZ [Gammaproteobacteria bacterium]|nr:sulfoxide reductase heme-binding subunit YedZ [Gammaproteobacteria bacterium]MDH5660466.1 sulfoxide reductase heme-binding subunit YedZ [Gammaproteobacteria bacterium]
MTRFIKPLIFILCLLPLSFLFINFYLDELGANPFEVLTRSTGEWTLRFLLLTLAMTPLRHVTGSSWPLRMRRMLGLFSFFYVCVHLLTYIFLDHFFDWNEILLDIVKRPYITLGMLAFTLLLPLAVTSTKKMMKRLGKRWKSLHKLIYVIAILGVLHFLLLVKADLREPIIYALILLALFLVRYKPELLNKLSFHSRY